MRYTAGLFVLTLLAGLACSPAPVTVVRPAPALPPIAPPVSASDAKVTPAAPAVVPTTASQAAAAGWSEPLPDEATERPEAKRAPRSWDPENADTDGADAEGSPNPARVLPQQGPVSYTHLTLPTKA